MRLCLSILRVRPILYRLPSRNSTKRKSHWSCGDTSQMDHLKTGHAKNFCDGSWLNTNRSRIHSNYAVQRILQGSDHQYSSQQSRSGQGCLIIVRSVQEDNLEPSFSLPLRLGKHILNVKIVTKLCLKPTSNGEPNNERTGSGYLCHRFFDTIGAERLRWGIFSLACGVWRSGRKN